MQAKGRYSDCYEDHYYDPFYGRYSSQLVKMVMTADITSPNYGAQIMAPKLWVLKGR